MAVYGKPVEANGESANGESINVSISIGVAAFHISSLVNGCDDLCREAGKALRQAREERRETGLWRRKNKVVFPAHLLLDK